MLVAFPFTNAWETALEPPKRGLLGSTQNQDSQYASARSEKSASYISAEIETKPLSPSGRPTLPVTV